MRLLLHSTLLLSSLATIISAQDSIQCDPENQCPQDSPCCSQYGQCGVGAYCLGGCDPTSSFSLAACAPAPVCKSAVYDFSTLSNLESNTKYLGDASLADWVYSGTPLPYSQDVLLTMSEGTVGTLVASTHYVWYGKVSAVMKTSAGAGVVTAFILLADSKDEIDFEFVGIELATAQTNFYNQGVTNYENGNNDTVSGQATNDGFHTYEIDWTPDTITWSIDGTSVRTLNREDTWNATAQRYSYPQTPARVQLSLWPAGLSTNAPGTVAWAGGLIDWQDQGNMANGYYYAQFATVSIECYNPPAGADVQGSESYVYTDAALTNSSVSVTGRGTVLGSFEADGLDMGRGGGSSNTTKTASAGGPKQTVPGAAGIGTVPGQTSAGGGGGGGGASSTAAGEGGSAQTGFVQGSGGMGTSGSSGGVEVRIPVRRLWGTLVAGVVVGVGCVVLL